MNISLSTPLIKDSTGQNEFAFIPIQTSNHKCLLLLLRTSPHSSFPYPLFPIVYQFEFSIFEFKKIVKQELQGYFHKTLNTFHPHSLIKDRKGGTNSSQRLHNEIPRTRVTREGGGEESAVSLFRQPAPPKIDRRTTTKPARPPVTRFPRLYSRREGVNPGEGVAIAACHYLACVEKNVSPPHLPRRNWIFIDTSRGVWPRGGGWWLRFDVYDDFPRHFSWITYE